MLADRIVFNRAGRYGIEIVERAKEAQDYGISKSRYHEHRRDGFSLG